MNNNNFSAIILAAGRSSRMGKAKIFLPYDNSMCFLEKIVSEYQQFNCKKIVIVVNSDVKKEIQQKDFLNFKNVIFVVNKYPENGRFLSLKIASKEINEDFAFLSNIDNPFIDNKLLSKISEINAENDFNVPTFKGKGGHPILLSKKIIQDIKNTKTNDLNFRDFLKNYKIQKTEISDEKILRNINTPKLYKEFFKT